MIASKCRTVTQIQLSSNIQFSENRWHLSLAKIMSPKHY